MNLNIFMCIVSYSRSSLMIIVLWTQFHVERPCGQRPFSIEHSVLNVKAVVAIFNLEKALAGAFSVITNLRLRMELFEALHFTLLTLTPRRYNLDVNISWVSS